MKRYITLLLATIFLTGCFYATKSQIKNERQACEYKVQTDCDSKFKKGEIVNVTVCLSAGNSECYKKNPI